MPDSELSLQIAEKAQQLAEAAKHNVLWLADAIRQDRYTSDELRAALPTELSGVDDFLDELLGRVDLRCEIVALAITNESLNSKLTTVRNDNHGLDGAMTNDPAIANPATRGVHNSFSTSHGHTF